MDRLHWHQDRRLHLTAVLLCSLFLYGVTTVNNTSSSLSSYTISSKTSSDPNNQKSSVSPTFSPVMQEEKEDINILCLGDSLTAGTFLKIGRNRQFAPYAPHLETFLKKKLIAQKSNDRGAIERDVHVNHTGRPGWTSYKLHHQILEDTLTKFKREDGSSSLDMIIIMAGSNDLFRQKYLTYNISESVISMHQLALDEDHKIPLTIAQDIPMSARFTGNDVVLQEKQALSSGLQAFANLESRTTYVPFPFGLEDVEYWNGDGVHCSADGYKKLAESLAPIVQKSLQDAGLW